ncbi:hypothetical protein BRADI_4g05523v3 [Brachypodium distachyon]|uniref:Uncharacterized protein n=1 Tax=Brachypodium distachyon TaxID=15368 RepID=A0A0Q3EJ69_BRADI|nr:hypothetical protein BRADI_4g05523v3 [Brachypodium distachyon]
MEPAGSWPRCSPSFSSVVAARTADPRASFTTHAPPHLLLRLRPLFSVVGFELCSVIHVNSSRSYFMIMMGVFSVYDSTFFI